MVSYGFILLIKSRIFIKPERWRALDKQTKMLIIIENKKTDNVK